MQPLEQTVEELKHTILVHDCKLKRDITLSFPIFSKDKLDPRVLLQKNGYEWVAQVGDGPNDTEKYETANKYSGRVIAWTVYEPNFHGSIQLEENGELVTYHSRPFIILFHNKSDLSTSV